MTVLLLSAGSGRHAPSWSGQELSSLISLYERYAAVGVASEWAIGATERDDPQFFILTEVPPLDCVLAISRVRGLYVLEDGAGNVLAERNSMAAVVESASRRLRPSWRAGIAGRLVLAAAAIRATIEERVEPILVETEELLVRVVPPLVAFI